jgi:phosphoglycolate phosphatase
VKSRFDRVKLVIFDLDGTLADTGRDLADSVNEIRRRRGLKAISRRAVLARVGQGVRNLLVNALPPAARRDLDRTITEFRAIYLKRCLDRTRLYPGVSKTLFSMKAARPRIRMAVVSNKPRLMSEKILRGLGIRRLFSAVLGGDDTPKRKPHPFPLLKLMDRFGASGAETMMVGDSRFDMEAGKRARCRICAATYGYGTGQETARWRPDYVIPSFSRLNGVLRRIARETTP